MSINQSINQCKKLLLASISVTLIPLGLAAEKELAPINVEANLTSSQYYRVNARQMMANSIQNERDLFKNQAGISVVEGGRAGSNGFNVRAMDTDRVAIRVDGMNMAESFMPRSIYTFGKMNGNRNGTEIENLSYVSLNKGADSVNGGNGALGGLIEMKTKNAEDFILAGNKIGFYSKTAYTSKNSEFRQVIGAGIKYAGVEALLQYTRRQGHELKNHDPNNAHEDVYQRERGIPDPVDFHTNSWLAKFGYHFNERHFLNFWYESSQPHRLTEEKSFYLAGARYSTDISPYKRYGVLYEYQPEQSWVKNLQIQFAKQQVEQISDGIQYFAQAQYRHLISQTDRSANEQKAKQLNLKLQTQDLSLLGINQAFTALVQAGSSQFKNINQDTRYPNTSIKTYNLINPVESKNFTISLQDQILLNKYLSSEIGASYSYYKYQRKQGIGFSSRTEKASPTEDKSLHALNWKAGLSWQLNPQLVLGYRFSSAFRAPRVEEMYFERYGADTYLPNFELKPETAQNHEITLNTENEYGTLSLSLFHTKYKNFIDETEEVNVIANPYYNPNYSWSQPYRIGNVYYQFQNVNKAHVNGIELNARLNGNALHLSENLYSTLSASYYRGKKSNGTSILSLQPFTAILGIGYQAPSQRWSILLSGRYVRAKHASEALQYNPRRAGERTFDANTGKVTKQIRPHRFLSQSYLIFDLNTEFKLNKNFSISMGVFNLFNRKYHTWESLRQIKNNGAVGDVYDDGRGLNRYTEPGRNYSIALEARF